jgi:hypothetical protein
MHQGPDRYYRSRLQGRQCHLHPGDPADHRFCIAVGFFPVVFTSAKQTYPPLQSIILSGSPLTKVESNLNPKALAKNRNGSLDIGLMQINSVHLPFLKKYGIEKDDLFNPKINIHVGAWVLRGCVNKHGENYKALNCYNGKVHNNNYYQKVLKNFYSLNYFPQIKKEVIS